MHDIRKVYDDICHAVRPVDLAKRIVNFDNRLLHAKYQCENNIEFILTKQFMMSFVSHNEDDVVAGKLVDEPQLFLDLFRIYANTYSSNHAANMFIKGFGANFETFSSKQMVNFCQSLGVTGH